MGEVLDLAGATASARAQLGGELVPGEVDRRGATVVGADLELQRRDPRREAMNVEPGTPDANADVVRGGSAPQ
jgi:hypothetical protein